MFEFNNLLSPVFREVVIISSITSGLFLFFFLIMKLLRIRNSTLIYNIYLTVLASFLAIPIIATVFAISPINKPHIDFKPVISEENIEVLEITDYESSSAKEGFLRGVEPIVNVPEELVEVNLKKFKLISILQTGKKVLPLLWFVGFLFFLGLLLSNLIKLFLIRKTARVIKAIEPEEYGFSSVKKLPLLESNKIKSPATIGLISPVILLPEGLLKETSVQDIKFILCHELTHILRKDFLVNLFQNILLSINYFNPIFWIFNKRLNILRENICDNWVLSKYPERKEYANLLLKFVEKFHGKRMMLQPSVGIFRSHSQIGNRIQHILKDSHLNIFVNSKLKRISLTLTLSLFLLVGWIYAGVQKPTSMVEEEHQIVKAEISSEQAKIDKNLSPEEIFKQIGTKDTTIDYSIVDTKGKEISSDKNIAINRYPTYKEIAYAISLKLPVPPDFEYEHLFKEGPTKEELKQVLEKNLDDPEIHLGAVLTEIESYQEAIKLFPNYIPLRCALVTKYLLKNDERLISELKNLTKLELDNATYNYLLANIYFNKKMRKEAIAEIEEGIKKEYVDLYQAEAGRAALKIKELAGMPKFLGLSTLVGIIQMPDLRNYRDVAKEIIKIGEEYEKNKDYKMAEKYYQMPVTIGKQIRYRAKFLITDLVSLAIKKIGYNALSEYYEERGLKNKKKIIEKHLTLLEKAIEFVRNQMKQDPILLSKYWCKLSERMFNAYIDAISENEINAIVDDPILTYSKEKGKWRLRGERKWYAMEISPEDIKEIKPYIDKAISAQDINEKASVNNLKQIGLALHLYAGDHNKKLLPDLKELYPKYLSSPKAFWSPNDMSPEPTDITNSAPSGWNSCQISYKYYPGYSTDNPNSSKIVVVDNSYTENRKQNISLYLDGHVMSIPIK